FFISSRRRHTRWPRDWSSDVCSSDLPAAVAAGQRGGPPAGAAPAVGTAGAAPAGGGGGRGAGPQAPGVPAVGPTGRGNILVAWEIGRASWRGKGGVSGGRGSRSGGQV